MEAVPICHTVVVTTGGGDVGGFAADRDRGVGQHESPRTPEGLPLVTGPQIRAERRRQRWSQVDFADAIGCALRTLKNIEDPDQAPEPHASSFYGRIIEVLGLDQPQVRASAVNPADPPLSQASKVQLARALYRIVSDEEAARRLAGEVDDFDVDGTDLLEGPAGSSGTGVVNRSSDDDPPAGTVQS